MKADADMDRQATVRCNGNRRGGVRDNLHHRILPLLVAGCFSAGALANPVGPQVINGQVGFANQGNVFSITNSPGSIINWQSFSIDAGDVTRFIQQSSSSSVLNRIVGQDPSKILGALQSNGRVFLINPNGIVFGSGAQVNVNGLVASTLNISNEDFLAGKLNFKAASSAADLQNQGSITTPSGGQVYLIAPNVENSGIITSPQGEVVLAAGRSVQLVDSADPDLHVVVSAPTDQALNLGQIVAQGGKIGIYGALINQRGLVSANSAVVGENGKIVFKASGDTILDTGSQTSATGAGKGGDIHILGNRVGLGGDASVDASGQTGGGSVLVGGDYHGDNPLIQNASRSYFSPYATIKADALQSGDGGKIVLWSNEVTRAYGSLSAQGGAKGGDGGFIESSSGQNLDFRAKVNVGAPLGKLGTLLLDPSTLTIIGGSGDGDLDGFPNSFKGGSTPGTINFADSVSTVYQSELEGTSANIVLEAIDYIVASGTFTASQVNLMPNSSLTMRTRNASTDNTGLIGIDLTASTNGNTLEFKTSGTGTISLMTGTGSSPQIAPIKVGKLTTDGGTVNLSATGNITANGIKTTPVNPGIGGAITLVTTGGSINSTADIDARGNTNPAGNVTLNSAGAVSMQSGATLYADHLDITSVGAIDDGSGGPVSTTINSLSLQNSGVGNVNIYDSTDLAIVSPGLNVGTNNLTLSNLGGNLTQSSGAIVANGLDISLSGSIGPLTTNVNTVAVAANGQSNISINNTSSSLTLGIFSQYDGSSPYDVVVSNSGSMIVQGNVATDYGTGSIHLTSGGPLTVLGGSTIGPGGSGSVILQAGGTGALTVNGGSVVTNGGNITAISPGGALTIASGSSVASDTGTINLQSGGTGTMTIGGSVATNSSGINLVSQGPMVISSYGAVASSGGGPVSLQAGLNGPNQLDINTYATVTSASGSVALAAGGAINVAGGAIVNGNATYSPNQYNPLPTLSQCIANPQTAGCDQVLPTISQCVANKALQGCQVVLPTIDQCVANKALQGCQVVLPTFDQCVANKALQGCQVVLPTIDQCIANKAVSGCQVVLPTFDQCVANNALPGCQVVLPTIDQCIANKAVSGCQVVLPTIDQCAANKALPGCQVVLPTFDQCVANKALPGCQVVLPTIAQCSALPLPQGCQVVLPTIGQCIVNPAQSGCQVVLPTFAQCVAASTTLGCSVVLPTLAQCAATPALAGCAAVIPTVATCESNPSEAGCSLVLPPTQSNPNPPITQALNTTVNIINTSANSGSSPSGNGAAGNGASVGNSGTNQTGATNNGTAKKLYCN